LCGANQPVQLKSPCLRPSGDLLTHITSSSLRALRITNRETQQSDSGIHPLSSILPPFDPPSTTELGVIKDSVEKTSIHGPSWRGPRKAKITVRECAWQDIKGQFPPTRFHSRTVRRNISQEMLKPDAYFPIPHNCEKIKDTSVGRYTLRGLSREERS